ncbi:MAG TPA: hypothetical protein VLH10_25900, partial [Yinghuangia sp.]|nr:hypothetical protein [Yinghuangia sp.]
MTSDPFRSDSFGSSGPDGAIRTRPFDLGRDAVIAYAVREPRPRTLDAADLLTAVGELALRKLPGVSDVTLAFWRNDALLAEVSTDIDLGEVVGAHDVDRPALHDLLAMQDLDPRHRRVRAEDPARERQRTARHRLPGVRLLEVVRRDRA